jgi:hypothetical protein
VVHDFELEPDRITKVFGKVMEAQKDFKGAELAKILRWTLKTDFGMK